MNTPGIIEHQTVRAIVDNVDQARQDILEAFKLLQGAKERLGHVLGDGQSSYYNSLFDRLSDYALERSAEEVDATVSRNAWKYILTQTGMTAYMTERRQKELQEQLQKGQFPALTVENVMSTFQGLTGQLGDLLLESVKEVFQWLRPKPCLGRYQYKTNKAYKVGLKVILTNMVESHWAGEKHLNYYRQANIRALGNVFSLLDGQGVPQYPHDLVTQLTAALKDVTWGEWCATPYLRAKPFANGNLHVVFTRTDLVDRLNQLGSDDSLPGEEVQKRSA